jgi:hypothetical protein
MSPDARLRERANNPFLDHLGEKVEGLNRRRVTP